MKVAGLSFEEQMVSSAIPTLRRKKTVMQISPAGQVPAPEDGEVCVWETLAFLEYLNENFLLPNHGPPTRPPTEARRTRPVARRVPPEYVAPGQYPSLERAGRGRGRPRRCQGDPFSSSLRAARAPSCLASFRPGTPSHGLRFATCTIYVASASLAYRDGVMAAREARTANASTYRAVGPARG